MHSSVGGGSKIGMFTINHKYQILGSKANSMISIANVEQEASTNKQIDNIISRKFKEDRNVIKNGTYFANKFFTSKRNSMPSNSKKTTSGMMQLRRTGLTGIWSFRIYEWIDMLKPVTNETSFTSKRRSMMPLKESTNVHTPSLPRSSRSNF